jgi:hypothetical protein
MSAFGGKADIVRQTGVSGWPPLIAILRVREIAVRYDRRRFGPGR